MATHVIRAPTGARAARTARFTVRMPGGRKRQFELPDAGATAGNVATLLGLRRGKGDTPYAWHDLNARLQDGLPYESLQIMLSAFGFSLKELADILGLSDRTLARRKEKGEKLSVAESDRLARFARVYTQAIGTFEDADKARQWLLTENLALGGTRPVDLLGTDAGVQEVDETLQRIEYGVYA